MATRREFLGALPAPVFAQSQSGMPQRMLGRTGQRVSILGLGGWHIAAVPDETEAIRIMHAAIDGGLTFFDNAWDYHDGRAEELMGKALQQDRKRQRVFLMTKNCERDYTGSMKCLEDSLRRLRTDYLDLWQFHEMVYDNDPDWVVEQGGLRAAIEAKRAGKVRYIGFTGHKDPRIHLKMLEKWNGWDTAQMPINICDYHYRSFQNEVVPVCLKQNVGVIGMKGLGGGFPQARLLEKLSLTPEDCLRYALSLPVSVQVAGINSMFHLEQDLAIARDFKPMTEAEMKAFRDKVKTPAGDGRHELFKSTKIHDGPHHRRQHGFDTGGA